MGIPRERLEELIERKDVDAALEAVHKYNYVECWKITDDGCLVIFNGDDPPAWLPPDEEE